MSNIHVQKIAQLTGHKASIYGLTRGPEPNLIYSGGGEGWIVRWDLDNPEMGKLISQIPTSVFSLHFIKKGKKIVAGNRDGGIHWIDMEKPEQTRNISHHRMGIFDLCETNDFLLSVGGKGLLTKWPLKEGLRESLRLSNASLRAVRYNQKNGHLAVGASDNNLYVLNAAAFDLQKTISDAHENSVFSLAYSPDGNYLLSGGRDAHLNVWDVNNDYRRVASLPAHWFTINSIVFHPKGHIFATASRDKTIKIWETDGFKLLKVLDYAKFGGHLNSVNRLLWVPYREYLISASDDNTMIIWDIRQKKNY